MSATDATGVDIAAFNRLDDESARRQLEACLAVRRWVEELLEGRPYADVGSLRQQAVASAQDLSDAELDAALAQHPRIGERATGSGEGALFSYREQAGVDPAGEEVRRRLEAGNAVYEARFGRVFLIRAVDRSAEEILAELERRLGNDDAEERRETLAQLREIALLRLDQVLAP